MADNFSLLDDYNATDSFSALDNYEPPKPSGSALKDIGVTGLKSAIGVPEAALGLADIVTSGRAGQAAENLGFRPKEAKAILDTHYSPEQQVKQQAVRSADGFLPSLKAYAENPSVAAHDLGEQIAPILAGGVISQGVRKVLPKAAPYVAGAIGEGALTAGQNIEQVRQETPGGLLDPMKQTLPIAASGALTGAIAAGSGKIANRLGITDIQSVLAGGQTAGGKGIAKNILGTTLLEGVGQELPQSMQEQVAQNYALNKPLTEGVGTAAAQGLVLGSAMGGGAAIVDPANYRKGPLTTAAEQAQPAFEQAPLINQPGQTPFKQRPSATDPASLINQAGPTPFKPRPTRPDAQTDNAADVSNIPPNGQPSPADTAVPGQTMGGSGASVGEASPTATAKQKRALARQQLEQAPVTNEADAKFIQNRIKILDTASDEALDKAIDTGIKAAAKRNINLTELNQEGVNENSIRFQDRGNQTDSTASDGRVKDSRAIIGSNGGGGELSSDADRQGKDSIVPEKPTIDSGTASLPEQRNNLADNLTEITNESNYQATGTEANQGDEFIDGKISLPQESSNLADNVAQAVKDRIEQEPQAKPKDIINEVTNQIGTTDEQRNANRPGQTENATYNADQGFGTQTRDDGAISSLTNARIGSSSEPTEPITTTDQLGLTDEKQNANESTNEETRQGQEDALLEFKPTHTDAFDNEPVMKVGENLYINQAQFEDQRQGKEVVPFEYAPEEVASYDQETTQAQDQATQAGTELPVAGDTGRSGGTDDNGTGRVLSGLPEQDEAAQGQDVSSSGSGVGALKETTPKHAPNRKYDWAMTKQEFVKNRLEWAERQLDSLTNDKQKRNWTTSNYTGNSVRSTQTVEEKQKEDAKYYKDFIEKLKQGDDEGIHKDIIKRAKSLNYYVPPEVLKDYPDLQNATQTPTPDNAPQPPAPNQDTLAERVPTPSAPEKAKSVTDIFNNDEKFNRLQGIAQKIKLSGYDYRPGAPYGTWLQRSSLNDKMSEKTSDKNISITTGISISDIKEVQLYADKVWSDYLYGKQNEEKNPITKPIAKSIANENKKPDISNSILKNEEGVDRFSPEKAVDAGTVAYALTTGRNTFSPKEADLLIKNKGLTDYQKTTPDKNGKVQLIKQETPIEQETRETEKAPQGKETAAEATVTPQDALKQKIAGNRKSKEGVINENETNKQDRIQNTDSKNTSNDDEIPAIYPNVIPAKETETEDSIAKTDTGNATISDNKESSSTIGTGQKSKLKPFSKQVEAESKSLKLKTQDAISRVKNEVRQRYEQQIKQDVAEGKTFSKDQLNDIADNRLEHLLDRKSLTVLGYSQDMQDQLYADNDVARLTDEVSKPQAVEPKEAKATETSMQKTAADLAKDMQNMRDKKPRSLDRMFGKIGPTLEQKAAYEESVRKWNAAYRKLSKLQKETLEKENAEFRAKNKPAQKTPESSQVAEDVSKKGEKVDTSDSGQELTYNKRNRIKSGIKWEDIADKNATLRVKEATKQNVYPRPNYEQMIDDGMQPAVAHIIKQVYDSIPTSPQSRNITDDDIRLYIQAVNRVMDGAMAWANDKQHGAHAWIKSQAVKAARMSAAYKGALTDITSLTENNSDEKRLLDYIYPDGWKAYRSEVQIISGNKTFGQLQPNIDELIRAMKDIDKGWPSKSEAWQRQGYKILSGEELTARTNYSSRSNGEKYAFANIKHKDRDVENKFFENVERGNPEVEQYATNRLNELKDKFILADKYSRFISAHESQEAATEAARDKVKKSKQDSNVSDKGISVSAAKREGITHRMEGENISSDKLRETFGFKGVNFGDWMKGDTPSKVAERQLHLNHAYDSFMDLANILKVPPQAVSLNGNLGLAIGAQGTGKYAAHFVPGVNEINLTRTSGAGSLAHEWGHGLDHYFAVQAGLERDKDPFITDNIAKVERNPNELRPEIIKAFKLIVDAMNKRLMTAEELKNSKNSRIDRLNKNIESWLKGGMKREAIRIGKEAEFNLLAERIRNNDLGDGLVSVSTKSALSPTIIELRELYKVGKGKGYSLEDMLALQMNLNSRNYHLANKEEAQEHIPQTSTNYSSAAAKLDSGKSKLYWSTPWEKFARAFDAFVSDTLEEQSASNTYLSHAGREGDTVPSGEERKAINAAFKTLIGEIKTKQTDKGVALYSQNTPTTGSTRQDLINRLDANDKKLLQSGRLNVVQKTSEVPKSAISIDANGIEGFYDPKSKSIWIIADNVTPENLSSVLNHEKLHASLDQNPKLKERLLGAQSELNDIFDLVESGQYTGRYKEIYDAAMKRVDRANTSPKDRFEEWLAYQVTQHNKSPASLPARLAKAIANLVSAIKAAIYRYSGYIGKISPADLSALAVSSMNYSKSSSGSNAVAMASKAQSKEQQEYDDTRAQYFGTKDWMKAPNGKPTNLNEVQWVQTRTPSFINWFGDWMNDPENASQVKDENGEPLVVYHGSLRDVPDSIKAPYFYVTESASEASAYAGSDINIRTGEMRSNKGLIGGRAYAFYANIKNPVLLSQHNVYFAGDAKYMDRDIAEWKMQGYDGVFMPWEGDYGLSSEVPKNFIAFAPNQIKSAISNTGAFSESNDIRYSIADDNLAEFKRRAGLGPKKTLVQTVQDILNRGIDANLQIIKDKWTELKPKIEQGVFDKFLGIKLAEKEIMGDVAHSLSGYIGARLSTGSSSTMSAVLQFGAPQWKDGIIQKKDGSKGFAEILKPVKDDLENFTAWMVARRADRLFKEGKENNFTKDQILAGLALKKEGYQKVADEIAALNSSMLDLAQDAGLIDAESRKTWESADYIPFYRLIEEQKNVGPRSKQGLSHQSSGIRMLKGGENPMSDPLGNMMQNWAHLVDAAMKNSALDKTLTNLEGSRFVTSIPRVQFKQALIPKEQIKKLMLESGLPKEVVDLMPAELTQGIAKMWAMQAPTDPDVVRVMRNGQSEYFKVNDPMLLTSLVAVNQSPLAGIFKPMRYMKSLLTGAVTADPTFMARNFIRDSLHSWTIAEEAGFKIGVDSIHGAVKSFKEEGGYIDMMFAGASFQGGYGNYNNPDAAKKSMEAVLRKKGIRNVNGFMDSIVDTPKKYWEMYRSIGDAIENANREAILENAKKAGAEKAQYLFEAKDIMDFSMQGSFTLVRAMSDMLPFFNARLVGLYRLAKAGKTEEARRIILMKGASIAMFSLALLAINADDDRYEALEDFEKDQYWNIFVGNQHFRIPKPFELGLIFGTIPERSARALIGKDTLKEYAARMGHGLSDTLAFNPVPQMFKPFVELYSNKNMFTGRPIEGMADEGKLPSARYNEYTSETMRTLSDVLPEALGLSPKRLEHLMQGYTGAMGMYVLGAADSLVRTMSGMPDEPTMRLDRVPVLKAFYQEKPAMHTVYGTQFYDMLRKTEQIQRTINAYKKEGRIDEANELQSDNADKLKFRKQLNKTSRSLSETRKKIDMIYRSKISADQKRLQIDNLMNQSNKSIQAIVKKTHPYFS